MSEDPVSKIRMVPLADLQPDPLNANRGTQRGDELLEMSLQEDGVGRGILISADGTVLAGNKTWAKAGELGFDKVIIVPTDGKTLVATQRIDVCDADERAKRMALRDNRVGELDLNWDPAELEALREDGIDLSGLWTDSEFASLIGTVPDVEFKEYGEEVEKQVEYLTCPNCGHKWPK